MEKRLKRTIHLLAATLVLCLPACDTGQRTAAPASPAGEAAEAPQRAMPPGGPPPHAGPRVVEEVIEVTRDAETGELDIAIDADHEAIPLSYRFKDVIHYTCGGVCKEADEIKTFDAKFAAYIDCQSHDVIDGPGLDEDPFKLLPPNGHQAKQGKIVSPPVQKDWVWLCWKMIYTVYGPDNEVVAQYDPHIFASP